MDTDNQKINEVGKEEIAEFYNAWCKETGRDGRLLKGSSVRELLSAFSKQYPTQANNSAGVWVKASERTPAIDCDYFTKVKVEGNKIYKSITLCLKGEFEMADVKGEVYEWLDESQFIG